MTLSLDTAYRSFGGEVEASGTPTICRLPDSRRHQLWAIAHWQNANAKIISVASPRRHSKSKESKQSAGKYPPNERAEVWHCRQDAVGSLLRSLDLSPRCNL